MLAGVKAAASRAGNVAQAVGNFAQAMAPPPPPPEWTTRMTQHDGAVKCEDWLMACFCTPCAASVAKSRVDRSNPCYNFLCWSPIGGYSYVRLAYGIIGTCGDDMCYGIWCPWCTTRQMYTESNVRGSLSGAYAANAGQWHFSLFDCTPCEICEVTFCFPCAVHEVRMNLPSQGAAIQSCCFDAMCVAPTSMYGQVRNDFGILSDFGPVEDVCLPIFCFPCTLNRARKEAVAQRMQGTAVAGMASGLLGAGRVAAYGARM